MSLNGVLACALSCALVFTAKFSYAAQSHETKAAADQEVLKLNEECNAAELRADVAAMDRCETEDFTHTHSNGMVEHKVEFIKGVGSGAHKFLTLDWSDVHVRSYGDSAIVEGHQHLRADNLGRIADNQLAVMTIWVKQQGKWREAAWIAALISRAEPASSEKK
jgi:ketosteroid isomerase-like protein